jgi:hypothetical protein
MPQDKDTQDKAAIFGRPEETPDQFFGLHAAELRATLESVASDLVDNAQGQIAFYAGSKEAQEEFAGRHSPSCTDTGNPRTP